MFIVGDRATGSQAPWERHEPNFARPRYCAVKQMPTHAAPTELKLFFRAA